MSWETYGKSGVSMHDGWHSEWTSCDNDCQSRVAQNDDWWTSKSWWANRRQKRASEDDDAGNGWKSWAEDESSLDDSSWAVDVLVCEADDVRDQPQHAEFGTAMHTLIFALALLTQTEEFTTFEIKFDEVWNDKLTAAVTK